MSMSAQTQVLSTVELLERILSFLPMPDLLFSQSVCRHWRVLVTSSITLQRALFLAPTLNVVADDPPPPSADADGALRQTIDAMRINPLLQSRFLVGWDVRQDAQTLWISPTARWRDALFRHGADASWTRMLIMQPPCPYRLLAHPGEDDPFGVGGPEPRAVSISLPVPPTCPIGEAMQLYLDICAREGDRVAGPRAWLRKTSGHAERRLDPGWTTVAGYAAAHEGRRGRPLT